MDRPSLPLTLDTHIKTGLESTVQCVKAAETENTAHSVMVEAAPKLVYDTDLKVCQNPVNVSIAAPHSPNLNNNQQDVSGLSSVQGHISRLSTFGTPGVTSTPNGDQTTTQQLLQTAERDSGLANNSSNSVNKCSGDSLCDSGSSATSGIKSLNNSSVNSTAGKAHVSFSCTVTEIPTTNIITSPPDTAINDGGAKSKKVPPPPPPRKSSRLLSPTAGKSSLKVRSVSPPTYENIENFATRKAAASKKDSKSGGNSPTSNKPTSPPSRIPQVGGKVTKYQQELASGIYSNMNRPDLQDQKLKPAEIVKAIGNAGNNGLTDDDKTKFIDDDSSSEDEESQGTVKRRPPSKETSPQPGNNEEQATGEVINSKLGSMGGKDSRRIPPPPPVRKTSTLSGGSVAESNNSGQTSSKLSSPEGVSKIPKIGFGQKKVTNGDIKGKNIKDRQYNETEIY